MSQPITIHVLFIEDSGIDANLYRDYLSPSDGINYQIEVTTHLRDGLLHLAKGKFDIVLLDLVLPDSHGLESLVRIVDQFPCIPVVVLTGLDMKQTAIDALRYGAQDYLIKGQINSDLLSRSIRHALERFRSEENLRQRQACLRMIIEQLPAILWTTDLELRFTSSQGAGLSALHLHAGEVVGKTLFDFFQTNDPNFPSIQAHQKALGGESISHDLEWQGKVFHTHIEPLRMGNSHIAGTIGVAVDITDTRRMEEELQVARKIQSRLQPRKTPKIPGFDISGASYPAIAAGGDYFDYLPSHENSLSVAIGDVSGHGFGAALLMATTRAYLRALSRVPLAVHESLNLVNGLIMEDLAGDDFVTLMLGRLDLSERTFVYCSAGHTPAYLLDRSGHVRERLKSTDIPLGIRQHHRFTCSKPVQLQSGDVLVLLTDGVLEAFSPDEAAGIFGEERMLATVRVYCQEAAQDIVYNLYHAVRSFSQYRPQDDDITAVVIKIA